MLTRFEMAAQAKALADVMAEDGLSLVERAERMAEVFDYFDPDRRLRLEYDMTPLTLRGPSVPGIGVLVPPIEVPASFTVTADGKILEGSLIK